MDVVTDTSAPKDFAALKHEIALLNDKARSPITSTVMSKEAALGANAGHILSFAGGAVAIAVAIFGLYAWLSFADNDRTLGWIMVAMMVFFIVAIVAAAAWGRHYWRSRLDERLSPLPPAGTRIRFDENTLVIGERTEPLSALRLDRIYVRTATRGSKFSSRAVYELDRLVMTTSGGALALDALCMTDGQRLVDNVYHAIGPTGAKVG